ncbi:hypothetical protein AMTR_s00208p00026010 [Amborella trichopoda]|uniref:Uncharacterized protein n=1 Tax=Amborella trichopoda TaxID=13333 RepID=W1PCP1_AMBTC|nr:hypothetical protein AMTR_s00208p00026010 [Amborella trichopoda]
MPTWHSPSFSSRMYTELPPLSPCAFSASHLSSCTFTMPTAMRFTCSVVRSHYHVPHHRAPLLLCRTLPLPRNYCHVPLLLCIDHHHCVTNTVVHPIAARLFSPSIAARPTLYLSHRALNQLR